MRVLVACEYSAIVRDAFRAKGHDAWSCDILPTEGDPKYHYQANVLHLINGAIGGANWDMMIAHPPCTYLANSGVRWLYKNGEKYLPRWLMVQQAKEFFEQLAAAPINKICMENPIQHKHAQLPRPDQIVQPWQFGDNESKAVCLWLKNLPALVPTHPVKPEKIEQRVWRMAPGPDRQKERSRFFRGIAAAMADQWGSLC